MTVENIADARRNGNRSGARIPPHNLDAERALLGSMLASGPALDIGLSSCSGVDFYAPKNGHVFDAIMGVRDAGEPVDTLTVDNELRRCGLIEAVGGSIYLLELLELRSSTSNVGGYAKMVCEHALSRRILGLMAEVTDRVYGGEDVGSLLDFARAGLFDMDTVGSVGAVSTADLYSAYMDELERRYDDPGGLSGIPTGFADLDAVLGGLPGGSLTILGARPAMGKSAMAVNIAAHAAFRLARPVLVFSLEMGVTDVMDRLLASEARVDLARLRSGRLVDTDWPKIGRAEIQSNLLHFEDGGARSVMQIMAECRRQKARHGSLGLIIVDYLQLMAGAAKAENQQVRIAGISQGLKLLARDLDAPVLALSSLSRALELRGDKRPVMSDLKDSGSIEADADAIIFLYRDEVYSPDSPDRGMAEVIVAKNRNGPTGVVKLSWLAAYTKFASMARM